MERGRVKKRSLPHVHILGRLSIKLFQEEKNWVNNLQVAIMNNLISYKTRNRKEWMESTFCIYVISNIK